VGSREKRRPRHKMCWNEAARRLRARQAMKGA
jgi:hypothetical protein